MLNVFGRSAKHSKAASTRRDVAIVQMGSTLPTSNPPIRVAEEYGMLDCISGARLVAGMSLGTSMDANLCYGISPIEQRERYYEAHDLILKAFVAARGLPPNPYRAGFAQLVVVSETDARAEEEYYPHIRYFYNKCLHIAPEFFSAPGYQDYRSLEHTLKKGFLKTQLELLVQNA